MKTGRPKPGLTPEARNEIAASIHWILADPCDEIRKAHLALHGSLRNLRTLVCHECLHFWTDCDPYLGKKRPDRCYITVGDRIVNVDDLWCMIRDGLKDDLRRDEAENG